MKSVEVAGRIVVVLRTSRWLEADLASTALADAGVKHHRHEEGSDTGETWWIFQVPEEAKGEALSILEALPIEAGPTGGPDSPVLTPRGRRRTKVWAYLTLGSLAAFVLWALVERLLDSFR